MIASGDLRSTAETVDPAWLTDVLRRSGALQSARVTDLTWKNVGAGMLGDSIRFDLRYDRDEEGAPASVVGKFPARDAVSRATGIDYGLYQTEVRFYQEIAATVAVRAPKCYYADVDPATGDFAVILEDLGPARQGNQLTGCSLADAEQAVEQLHRRNRAFPHTDGADGIGFDQCQIDYRSQRVGQRGSGHPSGRSAASDDHAQLWLSVHRDSPLSNLARSCPAVSEVSGASTPCA